MRAGLTKSEKSPSADVALGLLVAVAFPIGAAVGFAGTAGFALFVGFFVLFLIWIFGSAAYLWRSAPKVPVGEPAPA